MNHEIKLLVSKIHEVFPIGVALLFHEVPPSDRQHWAEFHGTDEYDLAILFSGRVWTEVNCDLIKNQSVSINFLSKKALHYLSPAFMEMYLTDSSCGLEIDVPSMLNPTSKERLFDEQSFDLFNIAQKIIVAKFLVVASQDGYHWAPNEAAKEALDNYWYQFLR